MKRLRLLPFLFLFLAVQAQASLPGLQDVLSAKGLLAPGTWCRVLRIEHSRDSTPYPKRFYALVFEVASALFFYCPSDGTQSLSHTYNTTKRDKLQLEPLLKDIVPGFKACEQDPAESEQPIVRKAHPLNACVVESLAALDRRQRAGARLEWAALFMTYFEYRKQEHGHTVLLYREHGQTYCIDPTREKEPWKVTEEQLRQPMLLAEEVCPGMELKSTRRFALPLADKSADVGAVAETGAGAAKPVL